MTCHLEDDPSMEYIAKIDNGVDYNFLSTAECEFRCVDPCVNCVDCMACADRDYALEARAYMALQDTPEEDFAPKFYGSWTFPLETDHSEKPVRWVRMILLERGEGETMQELLSRGELADEPVRLAVLKQLLEAVTKLDWYSKIRSMGNGAMFPPGNISVNSKNGSMKLISFRDAELLGYFEGFEESDDDDDPGPYSPIVQWWPFGRFSLLSLQKSGVLGAWIPKAWAEKPQLAARWLIDTFVDSPDYRRPTNHYRF